MSITPSLVGQLRRRLMDERVGRSAFSISCIDEAASDCLITITPGHVLQTNVANGRSAQSLNVALLDDAYCTVRKLFDYLSAQPGYTLAVTEDFMADHPSADLQVFGSISILGSASDLRHHMFADDELLEILDAACHRHNITYSPENLPENETQFVLMLAQAEANRRLAGSAAKRRGLETSVSELLQVAEDLERAYRSDTQRQARVIPVPKTDEGRVGHGDIIHGTISRQSLRTGYFAPLSSDGGGMTPIMLNPIEDSDIEDTRIRISWERNKEMRFWAMELWRDTIPNVERPENVMLTPPGPSILSESMRRPSTAKIVFRSVGARTTRDNIGWATFVEQAGQLVETFIDVGDISTEVGNNLFAAPPLEPDTVYYYRMYLISLNYEVVSGNTVNAKTKLMKASMDKTNPVSPTHGLAGTLVTVTGTNFSGQETLTFGGKPVVLTPVSSTKATFIVPAFTNQAAVGKRFDIVLTSSNGLRDVLLQGFQYSA